MENVMEPGQSKAMARALRAWRCSPFYGKLFWEMRSQSVALRSITEDRGILSGYTRQPLPELTAEQALNWLMSVGLLRREVDGQGLTDRFRLTPLGRQLLDQWQQQGCPDWRANLLDYVLDVGQRYLRLPTWLP